MAKNIRDCWRNEMRGGIKYFSKKLLGYELSSSMVSWATKFLTKPFGPFPTYALLSVGAGNDNTHHISFTRHTVVMIKFIASEQ